MWALRFARARVERRLRLSCRTLQPARSACAKFSIRETGASAIRLPTALNCGPRYTIIESLPYDRPRTTMKKFTMCAECEREYRDPSDRRFHAQPNACPQCGPQLELWSMEGAVLARRDAALDEAAEALRQGRIVGVKGLGGFHLMADARNEDAVRRLRERKHREEKPFALMFPAAEDVLRECELTPLEERLLRSPESPIVLVRRRNCGVHAGSIGSAGQSDAGRDAALHTFASSAHAGSRICGDRYQWQSER